MLRDKTLGAWHSFERFGMACLTQREEHLTAQEEGRRFSVCSSSIKPTLQVALLLGGYSTSASCDALLRRVDLPKASFHYHSTRPPFSQHGDLPHMYHDLPGLWLGRRIFNTTKPCLHFKPLVLPSRSLMFNFVCAKKVCFFGPSCTLWDIDGAMTLPSLDMTSSQPLYLHVDRGLERHGYPWV
jgi:hypothetical protein